MRRGGAAGLRGGSAEPRGKLRPEGAGAGGSGTPGHVSFCIPLNFSITGKIADTKLLSRQYCNFLLINLSIQIVIEQTLCQDSFGPQVRTIS